MKIIKINNGRKLHGTKFRKIKSGNYGAWVQYLAKRNDFRCFLNEASDGSCWIEVGKLFQDFIALYKTDCLHTFKRSNGGTGLFLFLVR